MLSWIKVLPKLNGKAENICEKKSEEKSKKKEKMRKKKKKKETKKQSHKKNLERLKQKSTICDYMNIHEQYKKELEARIASNEEGENYGDLHSRKMKSTVRVWFTNPCGVGLDPNKIKSHNSFYFLRYKSKCDIFGFAETNVNWHLLKGSASFYSRTKFYWQRFKTVTTHNVHAKHGINQRGGTCSAAVGQISHRVSSVGKDKTGLGRWVWVEFKGRENHITRVYTAYRPGSKPPKTSKKTTVYHQQAQYIRERQLNTDPWNMFDNDIVNELSTQMQNKRIVLMLDINQNAHTGTFNTRMMEIGLKNAFVTRNHGKIPATHHRGSQPISAIYHSTTLEITRTGILPIGLGVNGDHRNMFVDFSSSSFLGQQMYLVADNSIKTLKLDDPRVYRKFIKTLKDHLIQHNILERCQLLYSTAKYPPTKDTSIEMEELDSQLGRGISHALKKCRKVRLGKIPYSALFKSLQEQRRLWILVYKRKLGQKISSRLIRRLSKNTGYGKPLTYTMEEVKYKRNECEKAYETLVPHASTERRRFMEELAVTRASEMNIPRSKMIKRIMKAEQIREQNNIIRSHFPKSKGPSARVDKVEVRKGKEWIEVNKPRELVKELQKENSTKYNCTNATPLMQRDIHAQLGNFAETLYAEQIQKGEREPPEKLSDITKEMLQKTKYDHTIPKIPIIMTEEDIRNTWRITKENKASSPSGRYNAVYKAMTMDTYLLKTLTLSMNLPFATGRPYDRWSTYLDIMAFKKENNIRVDSLRSIILSEADWNAAGRIYVTRKMMGQAERLGLLPEEHLGGRKGRKSIDGAITKQLYMDNVNSTNKPTIILSTDAANCYDRMIHKYVSMMCSKWGLEKQVMKALLQPLQVARHYTRTAFGDSLTCFTGNNFQGAGQGNTGAAPFWTCVSTSMIELMKEAGFTSNLVTPLTNKKILLALIAFVDDAELFLTVDNNNLNALLEKAQRALERWKEVLLATGGAMRSKKCAWILLDHSKHNHDTNGELTLQDDDGETRPILRYHKSDPREYLGVTQTADSNDDEQLKIITDNVLKWNEMISKSKLPATLNLQALMNRIHRKILYPLPATNIEKEALQEVSDILYRTSLPKCGIIRKFPIRFRTLPSHYYGLGMPDLYLEMQIGKIKEFIHHCKSDTVMGKQLQFNLEDMQLQAGVQKFIVNYNHKKYSPLVQPGWTSNMWKFTSDLGFQFQGWKNDLQHQRLEDKFIMEELMQYGFSIKELQVLNRCRKYLQVLTLADITNGTGDRISQNFLDGKRDPTRKSTFSWSEIPKPGYNAWIKWSEAIRSVFCQTDTGYLLKQPLGRWLHTEYSTWEWYFDHSNKNLYHVQDRHYIRYTLTRERRTSTRIGCVWYKAREVIKGTVDTTKYQRATVTKETKGVKLVSFQGSAEWITKDKLINEQKTPVNLNQIIQQSTVHLPDIHLHNFTSISTDEVHHLFTDRYRIVADESYKTDSSSYCTIVESNDRTVQIVFSGACSENGSADTKNTDPYRSEMMGLYMGLLLTKIMEDFTTMETTVILSSDNDSALDSVGTYTWTKVNQQHFDIIKASLAVRKLIHSKILIERVQGHADQKKPKGPPTRLELLNQSCDFLAKLTREQAAPLGPTILPFEGLSIWHNGLKIYHDFGDMIRDVYYERKAIPILCDKLKLTHQQTKKIDWKSIRKSTKILSSYSNLWVSKYVTGFLPIGVNMERRNEWGSDYCSRCGTARENKQHIALCPEVSSTQLFYENLEVFEKWMEKMQAPTCLKINILTQITAWRSNTIWSRITEFPPPAPIEAQLTLGPWSQFMEGRLHVAWADHMQHHYNTTKSRRTGTQWASQCIQRIWTLFHIAQWHVRNKFVHNKTESTKSTRKSEELRFSIQQAYEAETKTNLLPRDQHLYDEPLHILQRLSDDGMIAWLKDYHLAVRDRNESFQVDASESSTLRAWMVPKRPGPNLPKSSPKRIKPSDDANQWSTTGSKEELRRGSWLPP